MELCSVNKILLCLRCILIIIPYPGYIHPDEYFQSPEPMAGEILNLKSHLTWEWKEKYAVRNILHPEISSGLAFWLLKLLQNLFQFHYTAEMLLILPRLFSLLFIHATEKYMMKTFQWVSKDINVHQFGLFLFRISYISSIFLSRTFSNLMEMALFTFLIYMVWSRIRCIEIARFSDTLFGMITAIGFFIRPTFLAYAFYPMFYLFQNLLQKSKSLISVVKFILIVSVGLLFGTLFMLTLDHLYYSDKTGIPWPVTPLNLILYNTNMQLLQQHGLHPRYLHIVVNMSLLLGPLYLMFIKIVIGGIVHSITEVKQMFVGLIWPSSHDKYDIKTFLILSAIIPICIISVIPHHEPRYVLPSVIPVFLVASSVIYKCPHRTKWIILFSIFNLLCIAWFGFLHQGGVYKSLAYMNRVLFERQENKSINLIFWHTYMVPQHLLGVSKSDHSVEVYDLAGSSIDAVRNTITAIFKQDNGSSTKIWLFCPSSLDKNATLILPFKLVKQFYPHITTEDFPVKEVLQFLGNVSFQTSYSNILYFLKNTFSLNGYILTS